ncbi:hypothetical protein T439DRAFT_49406 [Meredithblackwellia eburnea MCA 4105]
MRARLRHLRLCVLLIASTHPSVFPIQAGHNGLKCHFKEIRNSHFQLYLANQTGHARPHPSWGRLVPQGPIGQTANFPRSPALPRSLRCCRPLLGLFIALTDVIFD